QFSHAADRRLGVIVSRLDGAYETRHWAGARRLDLSRLPHVPNEEKDAGKWKVILSDDAENPPTIPVDSGKAG
ncbi:MAG TPA: hypothetical protein VGS41_01910, partial [Chthonomonadales bacterium]|nr:hypothetical protein [Chthonomonadales bacterium]